MTYGIDIGTTSVSGVAVGDDGKVAAVVSLAHEADLPAACEGAFEQDPGKLLATTEAVLAQLAGKAGPADEIGWTGQMHGVVGVDERLEPVTPFVTWRDRRLYGGRAMKGWLDEGRAIYKCLPVCGYVLARRTGRLVIDPTVLHAWYLDEFAGETRRRLEAWLPACEEGPLLGTYQRERILVLIDPTFDEQGIGARFHSKINLQSLTGGGLTGQGLFNGNRTQAGNLFAQHTDYIFSSIGEELGFLGCLLVMIMEIAIIARCIWVGTRCPDYMRRLVCFGAASALMFQVMINTGMCIGVMPVIGLTLPLISYGGSSVVTIYAMLGLVSGAYARPQSLSHERYIQPYR